MSAPASEQTKEQDFLAAPERPTDEKTVIARTSGDGQHVLNEEESGTNTIVEALSTVGDAPALSICESLTKEDRAIEEKDEETTPSWDSTDRRVMVCNVYKHIRNQDFSKHVKKWLSTLSDPESIVVTKWRKNPGAQWVILTCETEDMAQRLIEHINANEIDNGKGKKLTAVKATSKDNKRKREEDQDEDNDADMNKKQKHDSLPKYLTDDQVRDKLVPLWRLSYPDQLGEKFKTMINKSASRLCREVKKKFQTLEAESRRNANRKSVDLYAWLHSKRPLKVEDIIASPHHHSYRNKCEFTFGYRLIDGNPEQPIPSVGFMAAGWSGGVSRPHICPNIPWEACAVADLFEEFLQDSPLPPYELKGHTGVWRVLTIRISRRTRECMIIIQHAPPVAESSGEDYSDRFATEKQRMLKVLIDKDLLLPTRPIEVEEQHYPLRITSIFFQEYDGLSTPPPEYPVQHAYGKSCLTEKLGECLFQISPGAFFQINTEGAELLFQVVVDRIKEVCPSDSLLLDVCCGTGSIGMTCVKQGAVSEVVGVDISEPAIADANSNAKLNGLDDRVRFIASKAELVMSDETFRLRKSDSTVVAVVDPAREGLHPDVIRSIRMTEKIQRLIYVSCNPTGSLLQDAVILCGPPTKRFKGRAFRPTSAQPLDMFPQTDHCEMVVVFDRMTEEDEFGQRGTTIPGIS
jgi:tRNA (uracil-5-)-methyltransferase